MDDREIDREREKKVKKENNCVCVHLVVPCVYVLCVCEYVYVCAYYLAWRNVLLLFSFSSVQNLPEIGETEKQSLHTEKKHRIYIGYKTEIQVEKGGGGGGGEGEGGRTKGEERVKNRRRDRKFAKFIKKKTYTYIDLTKVWD